MLFNIGDIVVVKEWDEMISDGCTVDDDGLNGPDIDDNVWFNPKMKTFCGEVLKIIRECGNSYQCSSVSGKVYTVPKAIEEWYFADYMLKPFKNYDDDLFDTSVFDEMLFQYVLK